MTDSSELEWQRRSMPMMVRMIVGLTIFFLVVTVAQMAFLHWEYSEHPQEDRFEAVALLAIDEEASVEARLDATRLKAQILLEYEALERHFSIVNVSLMSRLWIKYLGFLTGMMMALIGATFILGKMREPVTEIGGGSEGQLTLNLKSASPGLIMVAVGAALMAATILVNHRINQSYKPMYANAIGGFAISEDDNLADLRRKSDELNARIEQLNEEQGQ